MEKTAQCDAFFSCDVINFVLGSQKVSFDCFKDKKRNVLAVEGSDYCLFGKLEMSLLTRIVCNTRRVCSVSKQS